MCYLIKLLRTPWTEFWPQSISTLYSYLFNWNWKLFPPDKWITVKGSAGPDLWLPAKLTIWRTISSIVSLSGKKIALNYQSPRFLFVFRTKLCETGTGIRFPFGDWWAKRFIVDGSWKKKNCFQKRFIIMNVLLW